MTIILETEHLLVRLFEERDTDAFVAMNQSAEVMRYFPSTLSRDETLTFINKIHTHYDTHGFSLYALERKTDKAFIGYTGFLTPYFTLPGFTPTETPVVEIGWRLDNAYWGQGYAPEAAIALLDYAAKQLGRRELVSFTATINQPSIRVMEKIGLTHHSDFIHPALKEDSPLRPHVLYYNRVSAKPGD